MNTFRACDAIEFVRAMDSCDGNPDVAREKLDKLNERLKAMDGSGQTTPSYILAAYRGYEAVLYPPMMIIKLNDIL